MFQRPCSRLGHEFDLLRREAIKDNWLAPRLAHAETGAFQDADGVGGLLAVGGLVGRREVLPKLEIVRFDFVEVVRSIPGVELLRHFLKYGSFELEAVGHNKGPQGLGVGWQWEYA